MCTKRNEVAYGDWIVEKFEGLMDWRSKLGKK